MFWFALSGPAGTGKTTLMYETVAMLRELGIEAVGSTERARMMPNVTHEELMEDQNLHTELMEAQKKVERQIEERQEADVVILDRCLVDYVVLGNLTFGRPIWVLPEDYVKKFTGIFVPAMLDSGSFTKKIRPDDEFRMKSKEAFDNYYRNLNIDIWVHDVDDPLRDRAKGVVDQILRSMGRTEVFRDWYRTTTIVKALKLISPWKDEDDLKVYVSGTQCHKSPTLPAYNSDLDLFVTFSGAEAMTDVYNGEIGQTEILLRRMFGGEVNITLLNEELAQLIELKEIVLED